MLNILNYLVRLVVVNMLNCLLNWVLNCMSNNGTWVSNPPIIWFRTFNELQQHLLGKGGFSYAAKILRIFPPLKHEFSLISTQSCHLNCSNCIITALIAQFNNKCLWKNAKWTNHRFAHILLQCNYGKCVFFFQFAKNIVLNVHWFLVGKWHRFSMLYFSGRCLCVFFAFLLFLNKWKTQR